MKNPLLILIASPVEPSSFKNFFSGEENTVKKILEEPGTTRRAGWDLRTLDQARLIEGEYFEVVNGERKKIHLYEDGTLILNASASYDFLGWGSSSDEFMKSPRLNPVALIEISYNFVDFYKKLIDYFIEKPSRIKIDINIKDAFIDENIKLHLNPYSVKSNSWGFDREKQDAPLNDMVRFIEVDTEDIEKKEEFVVYDIVKKIYTWFGLTEEKIPYTSERDGCKFINIEEIKNI